MRGVAGKFKRVGDGFEEISRSGLRVSCNAIKPTKIWGLSAALKYPQLQGGRGKWGAHLGVRSDNMGAKSYPLPSIVLGKAHFPKNLSVPKILSSLGTWIRSNAAWKTLCTPLQSPTDD